MANDLLKAIKEEQNKLNDQDAEGHVWWKKFEHMASQFSQSQGIGWVKASESEDFMYSMIWRVRFHEHGTHSIDRLDYDCHTDQNIYLKSKDHFGRQISYLRTNVEYLPESSEGQQVSTKAGEAEWEDIAKPPEAIGGKMRPVLIFDGKVRSVGYYFPDRFKTVEWEDWDDYTGEKDFAYTEEDNEKGIVWLRAGFYETVDCDRCDHYWKPIKATHWRKLPEPPQQPLSTLSPKTEGGEV